MKRVRKGTCILVAALILIMLLPVQAVAQGVSGPARLRLMKSQQATVDEALMALDAELHLRGMGAGVIVDALVKEARANIFVTSVRRESEKVFGYTLSSGMTCVYDYDLIHGTANEEIVELDKLYDNPEKEKVYHFSSENLNVAAFLPLFGVGSETGETYYDTIAPVLAQYTGGEFYYFLGDDCTAATLLTMVDYGVVFIHSVNAYYNGRSLIAVNNEEGISDSDYANGRAYSFVDGGVGLTGSFFSYYIPSDSMPSNMIYLSMGYCLGDGSMYSAFRNAGASVVYGFTDIVSASYSVNNAIALANAMRGIGEGVEYIYNLDEAHEYGQAWLGDYDPAAYDIYDVFSYVIYQGEGRWYMPPGTFSLTGLELSTRHIALDEIGDTAQLVITPEHYLSELTVRINKFGSPAINIDLEQVGFDYILNITAEQNGFAAIGIEVSDDLYESDIFEEMVYVTVGLTEFDEAMNKEGGEIRFINFDPHINTNYEWLTDATTFENRVTGVTTNSNQASSKSEMLCYLDIAAGQELVFDWAVESETDFDKMEFYVNDTLVTTITSETTGELTDWQQVRVRFPNTGTYLLRWGYYKDSTVDGGRDCGWVDDVYLHTPPESCDVTFMDGVDDSIIDTIQVAYGQMVDESLFPTPPEHQGYVFTHWDYDGAEIFDDIIITANYEATQVIGDIDGNGTVNSNDALMAIRNVLEIIELSPEQLELADVDGDGDVTSLDAIAILRMVLLD